MDIKHDKLPKEILDSVSKPFDMDLCVHLLLHC